MSLRKFQKNRNFWDSGPTSVCVGLLQGPKFVNQTGGIPPNECNWKEFQPFADYPADIRWISTEWIYKFRPWHYPGYLFAGPPRQRADRSSSDVTESAEYSTFSIKTQNLMNKIMNQKVNIWKDYFSSICPGIKFEKITKRNIISCFGNIP